MSYRGDPLTPMESQAMLGSSMGPRLGSFGAFGILGVFNNGSLGLPESEAPMIQHYWHPDVLVAPEFGHVQACQRRTEPSAWVSRRKAGTRHLTLHDPALSNLAVVSASLICRGT